MRSVARLPSRTVLFAAVAILLTASLSSASQPDCTALDCHELAYCEFNAANESVCNCPPGTIDTSGGSGQACDTNAFSVRYVVNADPGENPTAGMSDADGLSKAQGYFVKQVYDMAEVNCLYEDRPVNISAAGYNDVTSPDHVPYFTKPAIYQWVLDTTGAGLQIPPTGMTVDSVQFKTDCAESGCWVIKGVMTTGEAFNSKAAFNTFYLPQADITAEHPQGDLSYDFDYSDVEWTFSPADHPCTSANFDAEDNDISKVSTCCISNPATDSTGGFVANYRPTEAFVDWAGKLSCDVIFERDGEGLKCWKLYNDLLQPWSEAQASCRTAGGNLATPASSDELKLMGTYVAGTTNGNLNYEMPGGPGLWREPIWLGLRNWNSQGVYTWVTGSETDTSFGFRPGDKAWPPYTQECMAIQNGDSYWFDQTCNTKYAFMCEFSPPSFDPTCIQHVVARPEYAAPKPGIPCYKNSGQSLNYANAQALCETLGGSLPLIDDAAENMFFRRVLDYKGWWGAWVGANDLTNQSQTQDTWGYPDGVERPIFLSDTTPAGGKWCAWSTPGGGWSAVECDTRTQMSLCEIPRDVAEAQGLTCDSDVFDDLDEKWDVTYPLNPMSFLDVGKFKGMNASPGVVDLTNLDPFFGQWSFEIHLDEVELRSRAGKLTGTVGVEHTVDTYLGLANFRPTGLPVLDTFATQVNIHLEKTNFFSVSTHGTNDYTFLEYVNMRLVSILREDKDFSGVSTGTGMSGNANGDDEAGERTVRTNTTGNVNYVQVTFTLGSKYTVNSNPNADKYESGLIPLDSVRVGRGTFLDASTSMEHVCQEYELAEDANDDTQMVGLAVGRVAKGVFDDGVEQDCGPQAAMCTSPSSIPDSFVSFNIPLGSQVFDGQASNDLSNNIFVDFVVNALDPTASGTPNNGDDPRQMKTTLTASIPIVAGGVNIFCDGITAKTDLKDVANADIIVGTASSAAELTRLRIIENVASTDLAEVPSAQIDTPSIEAALMTLVLRGNESYFSTGASNTGGYSLELDDLITLHLMEDGDAGSVDGMGVSSNSKETTLIALLNEPADDNSDSNGLDTDGYKLNGAFRFAIARADGIAKLEPTAELLAICPFNPPRPAAGNTELETCIARRDVRSRAYPARTGAAFPTAMEIFNSEVMDGASAKTVNTWVQATEEDALGEQVVSEGSDPCPNTQNGDYSKASFADSGYACEAGFMTSILGDSEYSRKLAKDFVGAIRTRYDLNGRYTRAFWINPGYEWTPTQTAGQSLFQVSQKIYLFALITLDENWTRRRMLLQADADPTADSGSGTGGAKLEVAVTPKSMLASSFEVPEEKVAAFSVELQLTPAEACLSMVELQSALRLTLEDYLSSTASTFRTAQITRLTVDRGDEDCVTRRSLRKLLSGFSSATATVQLLVVFVEDAEAVFNQKAFADMAGVNSISADPNNAVTVDDNFKCSDCSPIGAGSASSSSSSDDTALIAGVCGGVGGAVLLAALAFVVMRRKPEEAVMAAPVQTVNVDDLKAQLQSDV